jgi:hypothetical protein
VTKEADSRRSALDLYSEDAWYDSQLEHQLSSLAFIIVFFLSLQASKGTVIQIMP